MKLGLQIVSVLCALLWPACFGSLFALNRKLDLENEEVVRIAPNVHSPTNFSALPSSSVIMIAPTVPHEPTNAQNSLAKAMSTSESASTSESSSSSSETGGVVTSTAGPTTTSTSSSTEPISSSTSSSNTKGPAMSTTHALPTKPTTTVVPPNPNTVSSSPTSTTIATPSTSHQSVQTIRSTGCGPPITVTVNNGAYCTNSPSPPQACSGDCTSKIGLSLGISIPGTAILTFLVTALSCLCCQRVKKKHSYIQLAPTVYFDEEEHD